VQLTHCVRNPLSKARCRRQDCGSSRLYMEEGLGHGWRLYLSTYSLRVLGPISTGSTIGDLLLNKPQSRSSITDQTSSGGYMAHGPSHLHWSLHCSWLVWPIAPHVLTNGMPRGESSHIPNSGEGKFTMNLEAELICQEET
jgi:hypothetical protein